MTDVTRESPEQGLADAFAVHVQRWAGALGACPADAAALRHAATELSLATSAGNVCLPLSILLPMPGGPAHVEAWRELLLSSGVVGTGDSPGSMPLVLDSCDRLYLHRYFDYERRLARRLMGLRAPQAGLADAVDRVKDRLDNLFQGNRSRLGEQADWQKLAAALALRGTLAVISGGPGTGKTTTVVNLLACLIELDPQCRIALAAPTGKAAARMTDAIRQRAANLPEAIRSRLPTESFTVHRLLGVTPADGGFVHHAGNPLAIDALVLDEASMLDLALATRLLEAVPASARIVLLGDKDQLSAVESGSVFAELSTDPSLSDSCISDLAALSGTPAERIEPPEPAVPSVLRDAVVWFTHNFRFAPDSGIGRLAALINAGAATQALALLASDPDGTVRWIDDGAMQLAVVTQAHMTDGYGGFRQAVLADPANLQAVSAAFARFRVLCAVREGQRGVVALNAALTKHWRHALGAADVDPDAPWFPGRPVMVLRNDYVLKLFNGDVGITLPDETGQLLVHFAQADGSFRAVAPVRLPQHETAFAMTIHKSQGSEFDHVMVVLPQQENRVLTRELLYTGVTRARSTLALCGAAPVISATIGAATQRHSGLLSRLSECQARPTGS